jgi:hypothetical protein
MKSIRIRPAAAWLLIAATWVLSAAARAGGIDTGDPLAFAAEMARQGNWREARYRWEQLVQQRPDDAKVLNNLAVALEVLGEAERAGELYDRAAALSSDDRDIEYNRRRFHDFWRSGSTESPPAAEAAERKRGKTLRVPVSLPIPPRLKLAGTEKLLVASFLCHETDLLDTNRELVRYLRGEFRKATAIEILDVVPPPAIPEQTLDDLLANAEIWRHLGRTHGADLIVSGMVVYDREDASSFKDVDYVSATTGQKVRSTRFVEQERFQYRLDVFFVDGATGEILFRDRLQRSALFQGLQNDPFAAFYELSESIASDVLAVVTQRTRSETRFVFKK